MCVCHMQFSGSLQVEALHQFPPFWKLFEYPDDGLNLTKTFLHLAAIDCSWLLLASYFWNAQFLLFALPFHDRDDYEVV